MVQKLMVTVKTLDGTFHCFSLFGHKRAVPSWELLLLELIPRSGMVGFVASARYSDTVVMASKNLEKSMPFVMKGLIGGKKGLFRSSMLGWRGNGWEGNGKKWNGIF